MKILLSLLLLPALLVLSSGRIRDDVPKSSYLELARQPQFECVGQVFRKGKSIGSCVLIRGQYVLTAAHLFYETTKYRLDTVFLENGQLAYWNVPLDTHKGNPSDYTFSFAGKRYSAEALTVHPVFDSTNQDDCDLAVVKLRQLVPNIVPARLNGQLNEVGSRTVGAGYGVFGLGSELRNHRLKQRLAGENMVDSLSDEFIYQGHPTMLLCDFDHPTRNDCNRMGSSTPLPLEYIGQGGDSGGGLFRQTPAGWELIGIYEGGDVDMEQMKKSGYYGSTEFWTRVSLFKDWVEAQMK